MHQKQFKNKKEMKKIYLIIVLALLGTSANAQYIGFGISKGFNSFSNPDRGNIGLSCVLWGIEAEFYFDTANYDDLNEDLGTHYTEYYKTYAGTSYTKVSGSKYYSGSMGWKVGYYLNDYLCLGLIWELAGGYMEIWHEHTHWSTIHDNWDEWGTRADIKDGFGGYIKGSYPIPLLHKSYKFPGLYLVPFASLQLTSTKHNYVSMGVMIAFKN